MKEASDVRLARRSPLPAAPPPEEKRLKTLLRLLMSPLLPPAPPPKMVEKMDENPLEIVVATLLPALRTVVKALLSPSEIVVVMLEKSRLANGTAGFGAGVGAGGGGGCGSGCLGVG